MADETNNPYSAPQPPPLQPKPKIRWFKFLPLLLLVLPIGCCGGLVYVSSIRAHLQNASYADLQEYGMFAAHVPPQAVNIDIQGAPFRGSGSARFKMPEADFKAWAEKEFKAKPVSVTPPGQVLDDAYVGTPAIRDELVIRNGWYHEERASRGSGEWFAFDADTGWCYSGWSTH